jgi:uncharacterized protein
MDRFNDLREKVLPLLRPYVRKVSVFGSFARGDDTLESDIDLLVELKPRELRPPLGFKWFGLWDELEEILGRKVDLVSESALSPYVRPHVEKDFMLLYEEEDP